MNNRRVTDDEKDTIRRMLREGASYGDIGLKTDRSPQAVRNLVWRYRLDVNDEGRSPVADYVPPSPPRRFSWEIAA